MKKDTAVMIITAAKRNLQAVREQNSRLCNTDRVVFYLSNL